jgi:hypothetical protein
VLNDKPKNQTHMKKLIFALFASVMLMSSCDQKQAPVPMDTAAAEEELIQVMDKMYEAYNGKDGESFVSVLSETGLFIGTDPDEYWDHASFSKAMTMMLADTAFHPDLTIERREIRFEDNGVEAFVVDQFYSEWCKEIPMRNVYHFIKSDGEWKCDFSSMALIPLNASLPAICSAVKSQAEASAE